jgi:hypothetical protein
VHRTGIAPRKDLPDPMSDQTTASPATASAARAADGPGAARIVGLAAVGVGLAALAGAAFVLSYAGIHAFALEAGISPRLARGYPLIFDVLLVVILAAVLALRGAGLPSKVLAWACLLALLSASAGADALHAAGRKLAAKDASVTAAIVPWVLVLIALVLLLAMLRQARFRRLSGDQETAHAQARLPWEPQQLPPASNRPLVPGFGQDEPSGAPPAIGTAPAVEPVPIEAPPAPADPGLIVPHQVTAESAAELAPDDAGSDETAVSPAGAEDSASRDDARSDESGSPGGGDSQASEPADPEMPVFHRMWSSPAPPAGE